VIKYSLLDLFDPAFGGDWLSVFAGPPYRTADEVGRAIDRAIDRDLRKVAEMRTK